jgi:CelD/BcsL family acetyltransferase involved in cellulose biosynthesis
MSVSKGSPRHNSADLRASASGLETSSVRGSGVFDALGPSLDDLLEATGAPIMACRAWLETWIACYPDHEPLAVGVRSLSQDALVAVALLATRRRRGILEVVRMGDGAADYARFPARNRHAARSLGSAVISELSRIRGPWSLFIGQLPPKDPVAHEVARNLRTAMVGPADGSPTVRFEMGRSLEDYVPHKVRANIRTRTNRMLRERLTPFFFRTRESGEIARILPEADAVRRARDGALDRRSKLDDERYLRFRHTVLRKLAAGGHVELAGLRVAGELIAYQIGLLDGTVYRQWDSRFHPAWRQFGPGTLLNVEALGSVLKDPRFTEFDFMRGVHAHKLEYATDVRAAESLVAWSSSNVRTIGSLEERFKKIVRGPRRGPARPSSPTQSIAGGDR